jgi:hypothetical protein
MAFDNDAALIRSRDSFDLPATLTVTSDQPTPLFHSVRAIRNAATATTATNALISNSEVIRNLSFGDLKLNGTSPWRDYNRPADYGYRSFLSRGRTVEATITKSRVPLRARQ